MQDKVWVLSFDCGSYDDYSNAAIGVFSTEAEAIKAQTKLKIHGQLGYTTIEEFKMDEMDVSESSKPYYHLKVGRLH